MTGSASLRCVMMARVTLLPLAARAVISGALSLGDGANQRAAIATGLTGALVNEQLLAEVPGTAIRAHVVAQCCAAETNRLLEYLADGGDQALGFVAFEAAGLATRTDAGLEQRFTGVDIPDAGDQLAVHDRLFDRQLATPRDPPQVLPVECRIERFRRQIRQQRVQLRVARHVEETAEAAWIIEAHALPGGEYQIDVIVWVPGQVAGHNSQASRHAQMPQHRAPCHAQQQILGAPLDRVDPLAGEDLLLRMTRG